MTSQDQEYRMIPLTQGQWAIVDVSDYEWLSRWKWCAHWDKHMKGYYAERAERESDGKLMHIKMHRQILGLKRGDGLHGDHALHNTLDNRRMVDGKVNLRIASPGQNGYNCKKRPHNTSGFKGVSKIGNVYRATIRVDGNYVYLGCRPTAELAYRELWLPASERFHGEFARSA